MTAVLGEKQYEIGGIVFGLGARVEVKSDGWTPGGPDLNRSDVKRASGDGVRFGRDRHGSATWGFDLFTNADSEDADAEQQAWDALAELHNAWGDDDVRQTSGAVVPLRYRIAGQTRRVYGRPRRWTPSPNNLSLSGRIDVVADFNTVDHLVYEDDVVEEWIDIAPPDDPNAGLIPPFIPPVTTTPRSAPRQGQIVVGGTVPTPIELEFHGPVAEAKVEVPGKPASAPGRQPFPGWTAGLKYAVLADDPVTLDAHPWVNAATKKSGGGAEVTPRTRISRMWLPPGTHDVIFTGVDTTGSASVAVRFRNAHRSAR